VAAQAKQVMLDRAEAWRSRFKMIVAANKVVDSDSCKREDRKIRRIKTRSII
jgi:hypothetical protein